MTIIQEVNNIKDKLIEIRSDFHKYPELSFKEERTSQKIAEILKDIGLDQVNTGIAKTGVLGLLRGGLPGKTFALRADIDALPIQEENDVPYKSMNKGVMHACGHDVHITSVLGAAMILAKMRDKIHGNVKFIFQPAEEIAGGAKLMVEAGVLDNPKVDGIIALHVWPGIDVGTIGVRSGPAMASMDKFEIVVRGPGGHGAMPHLANDPVVASAQIINTLQTVVSRTIDPIQPVVFSVCMIHGGDAFNIIPKEVRMIGTARTLDDQVKERAIAQVEKIIEGIGHAMGVECEFKYIDGCPSLINSPDMIKLIEEAGEDIVGKENIHIIAPTMGGEDFTYFARAIPGAMFCLGVRDKALGLTSIVHRATFDVSPEAVSIGVAILVNATLKYLNKFQ
ncbi:amidohydrolase [Candidatus Poribacteria bacterium]|nr:amidohydrolase [Candidatus Poribacteria bacterium]